MVAPSYATTEVECGGGWAAPTCHLTFKSTLVLRHIRRSLAHGLKIGCSIHTALEGRERRRATVCTAGGATLTSPDAHTTRFSLNSKKLTTRPRWPMAASVQCHIIKT